MTPRDETRQLVKTKHRTSRYLPPPRPPHTLSRRTPTRRSLDVWTSERWCGEERNWGCYFLPLSNVSVLFSGNVWNMRNNIFSLPVCCHRQRSQCQVK